MAVVKEIARLLEQSGVKVYCTRTTDRTVSKKARVRLANKRQADMLVSVHCNASDARKHSVRGIEVLYSKRDNGAGYTNKQLAAKLLKKTPVSAHRDLSYQFLHPDEIIRCVLLPNAKHGI